MLFYKLFKLAFEKAFSIKNIKFTWQKTSIWLYNPPKVLNIFKEHRNTNILINIKA
jgi:hypothetical protein